MNGIDLRVILEAPLRQFVLWLAMVARGDTAHELQQTHDGGLRWVKLKTVEWDSVQNLVNDQIGYALAYNRSIMAVMRTTDGGETWLIKPQATVSHVPCLISTWAICDR